MTDRQAEKRTDIRKPPGPRPDDEAASRRSGEVGSDKPRYKNEGPEVQRDADKRPNPAGPEFEEGGQYPGVRRDPARPRH